MPRQTEALLTLCNQLDFIVRDCDAAGPVAHTFARQRATAMAALTAARVLLREALLEQSNAELLKRLGELLAELARYGAWPSPASADLVEEPTLTDPTVGSDAPEPREI